MIFGNKIAHEWMEEYVAKIKSLKTAKSEDLIMILDKANQYKYRLIETLGEDEFNRQLESYSQRFDRLNKSVE